MDNHSKRNKDKYNPYTLLSNKDKNIYVVVFKDNRNKTHNIEVSKDIYNVFDKFELEDISQMHKYERHIEHSEVYEETIYSRSINKQTSLEEEVERKILYENIRTAMSKLTETQRRRINDKNNPFLDQGYVCCSTYGKPRSKGFHNRYYNKVFEENDLPRIRFHDLRHT